MQTHTVTTPFGRRPMSLGMIASQVAAQSAAPDATVHKWHVFRDIKEARLALGASDRALAILDALLSFHPETALYGDSALIVWPSNEMLIGRANGMSPATLRRHLANLVECGLIVRRDSPNGKRYARKGQGGEVEQAYGFDLSPMVARANEFKDLAEAVRAEKKAYKLVKERLTICRRDIVKMIEAGIEEGVPGNWGGAHLEYQAIVGRLPRTAPRQVLEAIAAELDDLWMQIRDVLESFVKSQNLNANESQTERHIQNSNTESKTESERGLGIKEEASGSAGGSDNLRSLPRRELPLGIVLDACPNLLWLVKGGGGIRNWRDFLTAADLARPVLGISPSAWEDARVALGEQQAAITIAAIYQKSDQIKSPGGYLRNLTERAKEG
ncbi:MAG: replication initiation protein RepC, partial [Devosia sp.]|nr:replication initiation protein RepC [Devosia sp.]